MNESGDKLDAAYRALAREEPGAAIDDAILAASRRAVAKPSASRRWAVPVSIAAVLVLAFGVTLNMRKESPGIESPTLDSYSGEPPASGTTAAPETQAPAEPPQERMLESKIAPKPAAPPAPAPAKKLAVQPKPDREQPRAMEERDRSLRDEARAAPERKDAKAKAAAADETFLHKEANVKQEPMPQAIAPASPAARMQAAPPVATAPVSNVPPPVTSRATASPPAPAASAPAPAPIVDAARLKREAVGSVTGERGLAAQAPAGRADTPSDEITRDLEAIAKLRAEGQHEKADKALEEFRRKHPGYRIPDAMWERVKPR